MITVALKGLLGRKLRAILTAFAIVLGVGMVSGTFIFTDTVHKAFDGVFSTPYKQTSVVISGRQIVTGAATNPTVPASLLPQVKALPGVEAAAGRFLFDTVKLVGRDGKAIGDGGPQLGFGIDPADARFNPLSLTAGTWATHPGEIVIGSAMAAKLHYKVGDSIDAKASGPVHRYTITGLIEFAGVSTGSATIAAFGVQEMQQLLGKSGRFDSISVVAEPGTSQARLARSIEPLLPATAQVRTAHQQATSDYKAIAGGTEFVRYLLLAFAAIALFVGSFVIFNTISMTVAQRTREFATLRTLGASRRQVMRSVLLESFVIGVFASIVGLVLGFGLAKAMDALFSGLPKASTVVESRTIVVSLVVGTLVTVIAGLFPAMRATRVPPISAVREAAVLPPARFARYKPILAAGVTILAIVTIAAGVFGGGDPKSVLIPAAGGTLLLFIGVAMMSSYLVPPLARFLGIPARLVGGSPGRLAAANSTRNPARTAATAAALMIGLALVTFVATLAAGLESSTKGDLGRQITADYVIHASESSGSTSISKATGSALAAVRGVTSVSGVRADKARILGATESVAGIDGATIAKVYRFAWKDGSDTVLAHLGNGAIVDTTYAKSHHLSVGDPITIETSAGVKRTFHIRATYHPKFQPVLEGVLISRAAFDHTFPNPSNTFTFVNTSTGASPRTTHALTHAVTPFTDVTVDTKASWITIQTNAVKQVLVVFYAFLALSVIVSLFGMVNTLVLSVFERTREIGMLRAVGMSRRKVRRMIRHESIITALIGAALGLPLGLFLAGILTRAFASQGMSFHVPLTQLAVFAVVAVIAGVLAALLPARRASRLNVLEALQYE